MLIDPQAVLNSITDRTIFNLITQVDLLKIAITTIKLIASLALSGLNKVVKAWMLIIVSKWWEAATSVTINHINRTHFTYKLSKKWKHPLGSNIPQVKIKVSTSIAYKIWTWTLPIPELTRVVSTITFHPLTNSNNQVPIPDKVVVVSTVPWIMNSNMITCNNNNSINKIVIIITSNNHRISNNNNSISNIKEVIKMLIRGMYSLCEEK